MKGFLKGLLIAFVILLLSAILAPLLFKFLPFKFERIFNRLVMIGTLGAIFLFVRLNWDTFSRYGLRYERRQSGRLFLKGFLAGAGILFFLTMTKIILGQAVVSVQEMAWWKYFSQFALFFGAGCLIGVIEEFFFRGAVFLGLKDRLIKNLFWSLLLTNLFYSLIHFIGDKSPFIGPEPTFFDSLKLMAAPFEALGDWQAYWPAAVGLFIFGLILNDLFLRTGSLYASIGLHAGCVFYLKADGLFVDHLHNSPLVFGTKNMYDGALGWVFLLILFVVSRAFIKGNTRQSVPATP